jgi:NAD(P)-dependent dehydrogenase (short-subunit alcohol dehydrogenase family)
VPTDVTQATEVEALARRAREAFGAVHVVCNNAGVAAFGTAWEQPVADWEWVLGVNLWGVVHGVRTFVPLLLEQGEGHVVNTASIAGLFTGPFLASYYVSKHAVVALSEVLYKELAARGAGVGVSVLCPGVTRTRIVDASRSTGVAAGEFRVAFARAMEEAAPPERIAERVVAAIREERFYVLPPPAALDPVRARFDAVLAERNPPP